MSVGAVPSAQRNSLPYLCFIDTFLSDATLSDYSAIISCMAINLDISCFYMNTLPVYSYNTVFLTVKEPLHKCLINFSKVPTTAEHNGNIYRTVQILCREGADYTTPQCVFSHQSQVDRDFWRKLCPSEKKKKRPFIFMFTSFCKSS